MARTTILEVGTGLLLYLAALDYIGCQSEDIANSFSQFSSHLENVTTISTQMAASMTQMVSIMKKTKNQELETLVDQQNVQTEILNSMVSLLQEHEHMLQNMTRDVNRLVEQQTEQIQALNTIAEAFRELEKRFVLLIIHYKYNVQFQIIVFSRFCSVF